MNNTKDADRKLILVDPNQGMCITLEQAFEQLPSVEVVNGYFEELPEFDCMVKPRQFFWVNGWWG